MPVQKMGRLPILWILYMTSNKTEIIYHNYMHLFQLGSFNIILIQQKHVSVLP